MSHCAWPSGQSHWAPTHSLGIISVGELALEELHELFTGWGIHVYPWLIHVNVWQKPLQYCKVISLQLIKKKKILSAFLPRTLTPVPRVFIQKKPQPHPFFSANCSCQLILVQSMHWAPSVVGRTWGSEWLVQVFHHPIWENGLVLLHQRDPLSFPSEALGCSLGPSLLPLSLFLPSPLCYEPEKLPERKGTRKTWSEES